MSSVVTFRIYDVSLDAVRVLTLTEGQEIVVEHGGPTEEGWHSERHTYHLDGARVVRESETDGQDCDGRLSTSTVYACPLTDLEAHECDGLGYPLWSRVTGRQRDYSAEAMGY